MRSWRMDYCVNSVGGYGFINCFWCKVNTRKWYYQTFDGMDEYGNNVIDKVQT